MLKSIFSYSIVLCLLLSSQGYASDSQVSGQQSQQSLSSVAKDLEGKTLDQVSSDIIPRQEINNIVAKMSSATGKRPSGIAAVKLTPSDIQIKEAQVLSVKQVKLILYCVKPRTFCPRMRLYLHNVMCEKAPRFFCFQSITY